MKGFVYASPSCQGGVYRVSLSLVPESLPYEVRHYGNVTCSLALPLRLFGLDFGQTIRFPRKGDCLIVDGECHGYSEVGLRGENCLVYVAPERFKVIRTGAMRAEGKKYRVGPETSEFRKQRRCRSRRGTVLALPAISIPPEQ